MLRCKMTKSKMLNVNDQVNKVVQNVLADDVLVKDRPVKTF